MPSLVFGLEVASRARRHGRRVFDDGRLELLGPGDKGWEAIPPPYPPDAVAALRDEVSAALAALEADEYGDPDAIDDGSRAVFALGRRTVVVDGWPSFTPPPLARLLDRADALRPTPAERSTWSLWTGERFVAFEIDGPLAGEPRLGALRDLIFGVGTPGPPPPGTPTPSPPPDDTPLVTATLVAGGSEQRLDVLPGGRVLVDGSATRELPASALAALRAELARLG